MTTTLYLVRHGATASNLEKPYRLQGRGRDPDLAPLGVRQAELTRDLLSVRPIERVYASPLRRARQTAAIIAQPAQRPVHIVDDLIECDVGAWEGLTWDEVARDFGPEYERFLADPAQHGYPGGESFDQVAVRARRVMHELMRSNSDATIVVVSHHVVLRVFLGSLLGISPAKARDVKLDNCGVSTVLCQDDQAELITLNACMHLEAVCEEAA